MGNKDKSRQVQTMDELTPRWAAFIGHYIESGSARQSAIKAGFSQQYADVITTRFPDKVRESLNDALNNKGITSEKIAEKINTLLDATTPIYKNNNETGEVEHVGDKPDYQAVDKGITHAIKIGVGGGYAAEKKQTVNLNVDVTEDSSDISKIRQEYEEKLQAKFLKGNAKQTSYTKRKTAKK